MLENKLQRIVVWIALLFLLAFQTTAAWAQKSNSSRVEFFQGSVINSGRVVGLGGAFVSVAEGEDGFIRLYPEDNWGGFVDIDFKDLLAGLDLGINYANRITPLSAEDLGLEQISRVGVKFYESGAVDNLTFVPIPEPTTAILVGGGLVAFGLAQRARRTLNTH